MSQRLLTDGRHTDVLAAFEMLLEELQDEIAWAQQCISTAAAQADYDAISQHLERARALEGVRGDLEATRGRLAALPGAPADPGPKPGDARVLPKLAKGLKTPQAAYRAPLLRALVALGGSADKNAVLERVYAEMQGDLNEHDLQSVPSDPSRPRWRVTAEWCRNTLRMEGLIRAGSPKGLWEITEAGRAWVEAQQAESSRSSKQGRAGTLMQRSNA